MRRTLLAAAVVSLWAGCAADVSEGSSDASEALSTTTSFQDGVSPSSAYAGETDTSLLEYAPATAQGSDGTLHVDRDYPDGTGKRASGLLRFDVSTIPAGSTVSAVKLTVNVSNATQAPGFNLFTVGKTWSQASATWNSPWSAAGALGASDRGASVLGNISATAGGKQSLLLNAAGLAAVQGWVKNPAGNFGLLLDSGENTNGLGFDSAQATTPANRPQLTVTYSTPTAAGNGTGLTAQYFKGTALAGTALLTRTDATVNFDWGTGTPASAVPADGFSVRWSGQVLPLYSESYTFTTTSDDGVRLWVNGQEIINNWTQHAATANSGSITLTAGQRYDLKLEYYEQTGQAVSKLAWKSTHQAAQIIPSAQLFPTTVTTPPVTSPPPTSHKYLRGVNNENFASSSAFGDGYGPAVDTVASYKYLYGRGNRLIRLIVMWGKQGSSPYGLQPVLGGPLDPTFLARLHQEVNNLHAAGLVAVLDLHNSCRFPDAHSATICGNGISTAQVKDIWTRLSEEFQNDEGVYAYDLMNEPYSISAAVWKQYSQAMVDAIRARGDKKRLWVEGINYSNANNWVTNNGAPWINDPDNNTAYEAHLYPPTSSGGNWAAVDPTYKSADDAWVGEVQHFTDWCNQYKEKCALGEFSVPTSLQTGTWQQWNALLDRLYNLLDANNLDATYFEAVSVIKNQPNQCYGHAAGNGFSMATKPAVPYDLDEGRTPAQIIEKHLTQ